MQVIKKIQNQKAFSIIEILVAMAIFSMIAATGVIAVLHSLSMTRLGLEKMKAVLLVDEGLDAIRSIKRHNWTALEAIDCSLGCGLDNSGGTWQLTSSPEDLNDYTRTVFIKSAKRDSLGLIVAGVGNDDQNLKEIEVLVDWNFNEVRVSSVNAKTYLAHYEQPFFISSDILSQWPFNEGFGTVTSSNNNLVATINGASWTSGAFGSALSFNGTSDYVELSNAESLTSSGQLTITAWVNPSDRSGGRIYVMKGTIPGTYNYQFGQFDRKLYFGVGDATGTYAMSSNTITKNDWQQVAATVNGQEVKFYKNGQLISTESLTVDVLPVAGNLFFGSELGQNYYFEGILDEIGIYNQIFTDQEILDKYTAEVNLIVEPRLWWPFDEASGSIATEFIKNYQSSFVGTVNWVTGIKNNAVSFNGSDAYLNMIEADGDFQNRIKREGAVSFWVKLDRQPASQYLFQVYDKKRSKDLIVEYEAAILSSDDQLRFIFGDSNYQAELSYDEMINKMQAGDGIWHHLLFTWDMAADQAQAYLDGQAFDNLIDISSLNWNTKVEEVCLAARCPGSAGGSATSFAKVEIDHFELFEDWMTAEQVASKYAQIIN